jgi:hypothetical protein
MAIPDRFVPFSTLSIRVYYSRRCPCIELVLGEAGWAVIITNSYSQFYPIRAALLRLPVLGCKFHPSVCSLDGSESNSITSIMGHIVDFFAVDNSLHIFLA